MAQEKVWGAAAEAMEERGSDVYHTPHCHGYEGLWQEHHDDLPVRRGTGYTIPIYCWYIECGDKTILVDSGEFSPIQSEAREKPLVARYTPVHTDGGMSVVIDTEKGKAVITGFCVIRAIFEPPKEIRAIEMEVIPPGTVVNTFDAYDIMLKIRGLADASFPCMSQPLRGLNQLPENRWP